MIKKRKAQSLMVSYVILISIVIALSIGVFTWLKYTANVEPPVNCKEGTSVRLVNISCSSSGVELELKNNGRFSVDGIILTVSNETELKNPTYLISNTAYSLLHPGSYFFTDELKPDKILSIHYKLEEIKMNGESGNVNFNEIKLVQIQPFILSKNGVVVCQDALFKQNVECSWEQE